MIKSLAFRSGTLMSYPAAILILALIVLSGAAVAGGRGAKWKAANLGIIAGIMAVGFGIGFLIGRISDDMTAGGHAATSLMLLLGGVAAVGCIVRNKLRHTPGELDSQTQPN